MDDLLELAATLAANDPHGRHKQAVQQLLMLAFSNHIEFIQPTVRHSAEELVELVVELGCGIHSSYISIDHVAAA